MFSTGAYDEEEQAFPNDASIRFSTGFVIGGHYEIIRPLGRGGMGEVYLARDTRLGRLVAIKFLLAHSGQSAERFITEARTTAQCHHENIVVIHDIGEYESIPYMVLEFIAGQSLRDALDERGDGMQTMAVEIMLPVIRALECAHAMGIVHRDLKPENILLAEAGPVKVVDFGIAKQVSPAPMTTFLPSPSGIDSLLVTHDGHFRGTMPYMSPEQWRHEGIDGRTDIWAAGIILYEIFVGKHPFEGRWASQLALVQDLDLPMPSVRDAVPEGGPLVDVIDRCLKKRKDERWSSAHELAMVLEQVNREKRASSGSGEDESPFTGLSAFQKSDTSRFFGRDDDIASVLAKLRSQQLVVIAGPSGAGKSSFVRAGLIPALERAGRESETFVVRPGRRPLAALAEALAFFQESVPEPDVADMERFADSLRAQPGLLGAKLRAHCRKRGPEHRILIFADQLEELYTLGIDPAERAIFCACIEGVADDASSPLRVVATIRADFLDRVAEDRKFWVEVARGLVFLPPMTRNGLRDAITKPLDAVGHRFEEETLVNEILDGLQGTTTPLPILQFTASRLWEARDRERRLLTREAYVALGGVAGALSTHADAVVASLSVPEQQLARAIFTELVTPERTRAIVRLDELLALAPEGAVVEHVVNHLADARLLLIDTTGESEGKTVELTHESLIDRWNKLQSWLDENQQDVQFLAQLRHAAQQWAKNGESEVFLWRDRAALDAGQWLERRRAEVGEDRALGLGKRDERYLEAVIGLAERTRRWRRRLAVVVFAGISAIAVVVSILAIRADEQARRADEKAKEAQEEARVARNATRMAAARQRREDPTTVLALLREIEMGPTPRGWAELAGWARTERVATKVLDHDGAVLFAAIDPSGKRIATARGDDVLVWDASGTHEPMVLHGHNKPVISVNWSADGKRIVSASVDTTVRIWNAHGSGQTIVLRGHEDEVNSAAFHPDGQRVVSASSDKTIRVWSADGAGEPLIFREHDARVNSAFFSPDGQHIVSTSNDKTVRVWNADGKQGKGPTLVLRGHDDGVTSAVFSPDGQHIASASRDRTLRVWNANGSGEPLILRGHEHKVASVGYSPDGAHIVSASNDNSVRIWNADGSGESMILKGHTAVVVMAAYGPDEQYVISASRDKTARIWRTSHSGGVLTLYGHTNLAQPPSFSPDGTHILSASVDECIRVWKADGTGIPLILRGHTGPVASAMYSPDGQHIVSAAWDGTARIWNADGSGEPSVLRGHGGPLNSAAYRPDGKQIVTASLDNTARIWNTDGSGEPIILRGHDGPLTAAQYSPDGIHIVTASRDKTARIWNADRTGEPLILRGHAAEVNSAAYSPDGRRILTTSSDTTVRVWNVEDLGQLVVLRGHEDIVWRAAWSPDGKRIASASQDKTVRIWNADGTGEPLVLHRSEFPLNGVEWSPDGGRVAAASDDKTIIVWSDLRPLEGPDDERLWLPTTYCMPLDVRRRLLDFSEAQSRADLQRCRQRVHHEIIGGF